MSNLDIVKRSYDAFSRKDMDGVMGDMHPEIVSHQAQGLPHGGTSRGLAEVERTPLDPPGPARAYALPAAPPAL